MKKHISKIKLPIIIKYLKQLDKKDSQWQAPYGGFWSPHNHRAVNHIGDSC